MNLNQITLPVVDLDLAMAFYRKLGFRLIVHTPPRYARFECPEGDSTFSLHSADVAATGVVVYFECQDLDVRVRALVDTGVTFTTLPQDERWLWREARLNDPSGNEICLYWAGENRKNPPWRVVA